MKRLILLACLLASWATLSTATVITFEGAAEPDSLLNVSPGAPYSEGGFTLTPTNEESAIFSATSGPILDGNSTDWFGFSGTNTITLSGAAPFDLDSMFIGPTDIGSGTITFTIVGQLFGGGTTSVTFTDLTTGGVQLIGFTNLASATFSSTSDAGIDDITITTSAIPEPASAILFTTGLLGLIGLQRWRTRKS